MNCYKPYPKYANKPFQGIAFANNLGDGYSIAINWFQAWSPSYQYQIVYNLYYSTNEMDLFDEGPKFVVLDPTQTSFTLTEFTPGDTYFLAVRASTIESSKNYLAGLPSAPNSLKTYPEAILTADINLTDTVIPITDVETFPAFGIVQIGHELVYYNGKDLVTGELVGAQRGYYGTNVRIHDVDGYDGYYDLSPIIHYFYGFDDANTSVLMTECKFSEPNYPFTFTDGYREVVDDVLHIDNTASDDAQVITTPYDFTGYRSTDPTDLLAGKCIGSYFGGEYGGCADGYNNVNQILRGMSVVTANDQREEVLLSTTGEPVVLMQRLWKGKNCYCYDSLRESCNPRCPSCYGTGIISAYVQYHNPRRSDGKILLRFDPSVDDLLPVDAGLESSFSPNTWGLSFPTLNDRDFILRFNTNANIDIEEYRYEVLRVTRNKLLLNNFGSQKIELARIRKTDPIYQVPVFRNTATMPRTVSTGIGFMKGPGNSLIPHVHTITLSEKITSITQINQMTEVSQAHNHTVINGKISIENHRNLDHTHEIIII